jgi:hypothetical protein
VLADGVLKLAATGQGAHDGCAAADIGTVADHNTLGNTAFHHGNAERAGVEVHEAGMHDGGAFGKVGTQTHAVGVADTHAGRHHIVDHARELVDRQHVHVNLRQSRNALVGRGHHVKLAQREILDRERAIIGPYHIVEGCENAVQIQGVRLGETHAQQMQTQVCVGCVFDRFVKLRHREHRNAAHATRIDALMGEIAKIMVRACHLLRSLAKLQFRVPYVQSVAGRIHAGQTPTPRSALIGHSSLLHNSDCITCMFPCNTLAAGLGEQHHKSMKQRKSNYRRSIGV